MDFEMKIGKIFIVGEEQWSQLFKRCNWYTFTLIHVEVENDKIMGAYEMSISFLGLKLRLRYTHTVTETASRIEADMAKIESGDLSGTQEFTSIEEFLAALHINTEGNEVSKIVVANDQAMEGLIDILKESKKE